ncbi:hypothetical protein [Haliangium sp. UPWRP_2]|nr:hypothetical protein [Haliangium sp. UPWRP_2]
MTPEIKLLVVLVLVVAAIKYRRDPLQVLRLFIEVCRTAEQIV